MEYAKLILNNNYYRYEKSNSLKMSILAMFLKSDTPHFLEDYKKWALTDKNTPNAEYAETYGGNCTNLEDDNGIIYLDNEYLQDKNTPTRLKMSREQFVQILDEWDQKVVKANPKPKEVIIKQENDQFTIETTE